MLHVKELNPVGKEVQYEISLFIDGKPTHENEMVKPLEDETHLTFISRIASEVAYYNNLPNNKEAKREKRLITK